MAGCNVVGLNDCIVGAVLSALTASDTYVLINSEGEHALTYACRTLLLNNVSDILIAEELKSCKNGVRSSLTETAKRVSLDVVAKLLKLVNVLESSLTVGDLLKNLEKSSCTNTAGCALTAGLVNGELKEELSHVNHTGVLVHNDKTA